MAGQARSFQRKKVCRFCTENLPIDFKDQATLHSYLTERGGEANAKDLPPPST